LAAKQAVQLDRPILIGGCGSSGTTLLRELIDLSPTIFCGPELSFLNKRQLYEQPYSQTRDEFKQYLDQGIPTMASLSIAWLPWSATFSHRREYRFMENPQNYGYTPAELDELPQHFSSFSDLVDGFFAKTLQQAGKLRWAEKTPTNCYCIQQFLDLYPQGRYVQAIRDGRDVVPSLVKRGYPAPIAVRRWMYDTACGLRFRGQPRYTEVRYEALVTQPEQTLQALYTFLGEEPPGALPANSVNLGGIVEHATWTLQPGQGISTSALGKWKKADYPQKVNIEELFYANRFSRHSRRFLGLPENMNGNDLLSMLGYDPQEGWNTRPLRGRTLGSLQPLLKRFANERLRRGLPPGLDYFKISL